MYFVFLKARIWVTLQLEIRPDGLLDSQYSACAAHMLSAFNNKTVEVQSVQSLVGNAVCAQLNLDQNSTSQIKQEFSCLSASQPAQQEDNKHACCKKWASTQENLTLLHVNNKGADQTAHTQSVPLLFAIENV